MVEVAERLADCEYERGMLGRAANFYKKAIEIRLKIFGPGHRELARVLGRFADTEYRQGHFQQAAPAFEQALQIWEEDHQLVRNEPMYAYVALAAGDSADIYSMQGNSMQGNFSKAEGLYQAAQRY